MDVSEKGYSVLRSFEGRALKAYRCPAGVWTIGYGNTNHDAFAVAYLGRKIGPGLTITDDQAEFLLRESVRRNYVPAVAKAMSGAKQNELDAGADFHYNTGAIARASWVKHWLAHNFEAMTPALLSWNKAAGQVLRGLDRRRRREDAMIKAGDYGPEGVMKPPVINGGHLAGTPGMLRKGDSGPEVADLNDSLALLGFKVTTPNAVFDDATEAAVRAFQRTHKQLAEDGIAGPATRAALKREADAKRKLGNTAKGGSAPIGAETLDQSGLTHDSILPTWSLWLTVAAVLLIAGYFAWQYRDEIMAYAKRITEKHNG